MQMHPHPSRSSSLAIQWRHLPSLILVLLMGLGGQSPAQSFRHALSLRVSDRLEALTNAPGMDPCVVVIDSADPGIYPMTCTPDSLPQLPGHRLYRVRLETTNEYLLDNGGAVIMSCKYGKELPPTHLLAMQAPDGRAILLSGSLAPDSAHTWAPAGLSVADHAQVRLAYLQPSGFKAGRCTRGWCAFRAHSELLGRRVEIRIAPEDVDRFEIARLGWRRVVLTPQVSLEKDWEDR